MRLPHPLFTMPEPLSHTRAETSPSSAMVPARHLCRQRGAGARRAHTGCEPPLGLHQGMAHLKDSYCALCRRANSSSKAETRDSSSWLSGPGCKTEVLVSTGTSPGLTAAESDHGASVVHSKTMITTTNVQQSRDGQKQPPPQTWGRHKAGRMASPPVTREACGSPRYPGAAGTGRCTQRPQNQKGKRPPERAQASSVWLKGQMFGTRPAAMRQICWQSSNQPGTLSNPTCLQQNSASGRRTFGRGTHSHSSFCLPSAMKMGCFCQQHQAHGLARQPEARLQDGALAHGRHRCASVWSYCSKRIISSIMYIAVCESRRRHGFTAAHLARARLSCQHVGALTASVGTNTTSCVFMN